MKRLLILLFIFTAIAAHSQKSYFTGEFRSADNQYYWKNKLPFIGYWQQDVAYKIKATLDDSLDMLDGELLLTYYNNSPDVLKEVYFHLYQNAFQPGSYYDDLQKNNHIKTVYGKNEKDKKDEVVESVLINNIPVFPTYDNTIMKLILPQPLSPNGQVEFKIKFKSYFGDGGNVRRRMKMFRDAWGNKQYDGVHWYPRICVYDRKFGWNTDQHLGREFYGDFGTYDAEVTLPSNYVNEATGELVNESEVMPAALRQQLDVKNFAGKKMDSKPELILERKGTKTWKYHAVNVHDFAFTCDPTYRISEAQWNGIRCIGIVQEPHAAGWQTSGALVADIVKTYSTDIGMFAYPKMVAADAQDGMEYPMLTLDGGSAPGYTNLFSHEIGHNWFFGMVGNNETYRACLDEGFTQFLTSWYMTKQEALKGEPHYKSAYVQRYVTHLTERDAVAYSGYMLDAINDNDETLNQHSDAFNGAVGHGGGYRHVYFKTATMLWNLQYVLGDSLFLKALQNYFSEFKICHPYVEDFRNSVIHFTHVDINWFFDQWFETNKHIDYEVESVKHKDADNYEIIFERHGRMQMPIDFTVTSKDGKTYDFYIPNTYFIKQTNATVLPYWKGWDLLQPTYKCTVTIPGGIKDVVIDPTHRLADIDFSNNTYKCPIKFTFDHQLLNPYDFYHYQLKWRPDIWFNSLDGVKAGVNINGNYMNRKNVWDLTVWYNTGLRQLIRYQVKVVGLPEDPLKDHHDPFSYRFNYSNTIGKFLTWNFGTKYLDGLFANKIGINKSFNGYDLYANFNSLYRNNITFYKNGVDDKRYLLYPDLWNLGTWNNFINIGFNKNHNYSFGYATQNLNMRSSAFGSGYQYGSLSFTRIDNITKGKLDFRLRSFIQLGSHNFAPESQLMLAGANNEELMESKYTRSVGFVPSKWTGFGAGINHFQQGGGLNIRGFAGYKAPVGDTTNQYLLYKGNRGVALNAELDLDRLIKLTPRLTRNWLHIDIYAFADAGIIADKPLTGKWFFANAFRSDAGIGTAFTIKRWGYLGNIKPFTIRVDFPFLINPTPLNTPYAAYRYVVGIGRCF
jgi:hypothetical protein